MLLDEPELKGVSVAAAEPDAEGKPDSVADALSDALDVTETEPDGVAVGELDMQTASAVLLHAANAPQVHKEQLRQELEPLNAA